MFTYEDAVRVVQAIDDLIQSKIAAQKAQDAGDDDDGQYGLDAMQQKDELTKVLYLHLKD